MRKRSDVQATTTQLHFADISNIERTATQRCIQETTTHADTQFCDGQIAGVQTTTTQTAVNDGDIAGVQTTTTQAAVNDGDQTTTTQAAVNDGDIAGVQTTTTQAAVNDGDIACVQTTTTQATVNVLDIAGVQNGGDICDVQTALQIISAQSEVPTADFFSVQPTMTQNLWLVAVDELSIMPDDILVPLGSVSLTPVCDATSLDLAHDSGVGDSGHGMRSTPTSCVGRRKTRRKLTTTRRSMPNVIVTRSKAGSTDVSPSPVTVNQKSAKKKSKKLSCQSSVQFVDLPSGSEDSELSESCDDEVKVKTNCSVAKQPRRVIVPETEASSSRSLKQSCSWTDGGLQYDPDGTHSFTGDVSLSEDVSHLVTPLQFFRYFFNDEIIQLIAHQPTLCSVQRCPSNSLVVTKCDIESFIGIAMTMSLIKLASSRKYWSNRFRIHQIADVMSFNNFSRVKRFLHFSDNMESSSDKLKKLRTLVSKLRDCFRSVPLEQNLSVDEQMIPFKGRHGLKQYLPKKPHKWGYKVFVLSGVSGYAYDSEIYSGKQDNIVSEEEADCGASGNVVIRLSRGVPNCCNFRIFFDNYFNSVDLQLALARRGILGVGTVRLNRLHKTDLMSDAELAKRGRGAYQEKVASVDGVQLSVVRWFDTRPISFLSTFVGEEPVSRIKHYHRVKHEEQQVPCPKVVHVYNQHMGGVDLLDSLIGFYRTRIRSRKWYHRVFFHLMDLTVVNAWLLYRRCFPSNCKLLRLHDFKADIAEGLCKQGKDELRSKMLKRSRQNSVNADSEPSSAKRQKQVLTPQPCVDVRYDGIGHWPEWRQVMATCRLEGCKCVSRVFCRKCRVSLCHNPKKDCFYSFHNGC